MKKLPELEVGFGEIYKLVIQPIKTKVLLAGIELGIFGHLSQPTSAEAVAQAIETHPGNTGLLLDGLASMDLVRKKNGQYQNTPAAQAFLVKGSPTFLGQVLTRGAATEACGLEDMLALVREGPSLALKANTASDEMSADDVSSYVNFERAGLAQKIAGIAATLPEFPSFRKMLDLGGGPGINGIAIVTAHPSMKGVIFDRPKTSEVAKASVREYELTDRMEVISGDYTRDSFGGEYDLILASDTLYYGEDEMLPLMKRILAALNPGGVFLSLHQGLTNERTKPEIMVLGSLLDGLSGEDMGLLDRGFIAEAMLRAGFKSVRSRTRETDWGALDLDVGRK